MASISSVFIVAGVIAITRYLINSNKSEEEENIMNKNEEISFNKFKLGRMHFENKDYSNALHYFSEAISIYPTATYYNDRACVYSAINKLDKAIEDCHQAIRMEPEESHFYVCRGIIYFTMQQFENCINDWKRSKELGSNDAQELLRIYFEAKPAWFNYAPSIDHFKYITVNEQNNLLFQEDAVDELYCQTITYINDSTYKIYLN
jgi:tetratricopeptide (TPR) repeat protein